MALLRILNGSLESQEIELSPDPMTVGRASACNIRIADAGVSSKHAKIWCEDGQYFLMDLGSTNGTFVNDRDVDREQLNDGDVITFGMTKASFVGEKPKPRASPNRPQQRPVATPPPSRNPARAAAVAAVPAPEGIVTDEPRRNDAPSLRAEVKTQDELEIATLRGRVAFFEEENRRLKVQVKQGQEQAAHDAAASARADAEKIRTLLKQREEELKKLQKELDEKETYYSPAELERERKRMEAAIEAERRRDTETLQRQIKELEHRVAIRGAESDTVGRQLKEKDDLIQMLSEREDALDARLKVEGQLSEFLRRSGDRDQHEKQLAMLKADRDARAAEAKAAADARDAAEQQLARIRGTYDDIVHERDELKARVEGLQSEMRVAATGSQLQGDWEARYKSAAEEVNDLKKQ